MIATAILKPGREKSLLRRHPWVFASAIARVEGAAPPGASVQVRAGDGTFLAMAAYNPSSQIALRAWDFAERSIDAEYFRERLHRAIALRRWLHGNTLPETCRLVHAESDGLPGVTVDRYGATLVLACTSAGALAHRSTIADALVAGTGLGDVFERSDSDAMALEGLAPSVGPLHGTPVERVIITEHGLRYGVDVRNGHKTGWYLDQRENRARFGALAADRDVLNCFCYTGGFTLNALSGGARSVLSIDSSGPALAVARDNMALNALPADRAEWREADVFKELRRLRDEGRKFDLIALDPPKFAPTVQFAEKAARGYKDINLLAFRLLRPGGVLMTFSCSGGVDAALFQKIVAGAALDARVEAQILHTLSAAPDHPLLASFPEGAYLKGLVLRLY